MKHTFEIYCSIFSDEGNSQTPVWITDGSYKDGILTLTCESDSDDLRLEMKEVLGKAASGACRRLPNSQPHS